MPLCALALGWGATLPNSLHPNSASNKPCDSTSYRDTETVPLIKTTLGFSLPQGQPPAGWLCLLQAHVCLFLIHPLQLLDTVTQWACGSGSVAVLSPRLDCEFLRGGNENSHRYSGKGLMESPCNQMHWLRSCQWSWVIMATGSQEDGVGGP